MNLRGALAALLLRGPGHGYLLQAMLDRELGRLWVTRPSQVYLTLGRMNRDGFVTLRRVRQTTRPDRHVFELTKRGVGLATDWLFEPGPAEEIALKLAVCRVARPDRFVELIDILERDRMAVVHALRGVLSSTSGFERHAIALDLARAQADLRWLSSLRQRASELLAVPSAEASAVEGSEAKLA